MCKFTIHNSGGTVSLLLLFIISPLSVATQIYFFSSMVCSLNLTYKTAYAPSLKTYKCCYSISISLSILRMQMMMMGVGWLGGVGGNIGLMTLRPRWVLHSPHPRTTSKKEGGEGGEAGEGAGVGAGGRVKRRRRPMRGQNGTPSFMRTNSTRAPHGLHWPDQLLSLTLLLALSTSTHLEYNTTKIAHIHIHLKRPPQVL